jgi:C-terminal processing protease CtpA/Prc
MTVLAQSDALIIDLRHNTGGDADMTHLLAAYILDGPEQMSSLYDRPSGRTIVATAPAWVPGRRFGGHKPVYVLVSHETFSAAEAFAYDLQALKRVTVVGERTGGGAHPYANHRLTPHLMLRLPEMRVVNPITGRDWEDVGVQPDVPTPAAAALETALRLAWAKVPQDGTAVTPKAESQCRRDHG